MFSQVPAQVGALVHPQDLGCRSVPDFVVRHRKHSVAGSRHRYRLLRIFFNAFSSASRAASFALISSSSSSSGDMHIPDRTASSSSRESALASASASNVRSTASRWRDGSSGARGGWQCYSRMSSQFIKGMQMISYAQERQGGMLPGCFPQHPRCSGVCFAESRESRNVA
jgi:hypothetical protein